MVPDQDWCLACGTAAPGRLGTRPGWRAATTVIGITAVLVVGAVAAGYAALTGNASREAAAPAPPSAAPIVQAPPADTTPAAPPAATTTTPTAPATPAAPAKGGAGALPKVKVPGSASAGAVPARPVAPAKHTTPSSTGSGTTPSTTTPTHTSTGTTTTPAVTPKPAAPTPISLGSDAGSIYDPYQRAAQAGDASKALDGDPSTAWFVTAKSSDQMGVGYDVDLGKLRGVRELELTTSTPGFRIEVYATDAASPPPDILDTRWSHITNRSGVDSATGAKAEDGNKPGDGKERIVLGSGSSKYRHVLLWFTQPPKDGATIKISELQLLH
ncbi:MAG: hypothetical protein JWO74_606 [Solirubrobacterales bacterium]|nr:hypothetical protein [Solirubrobacterales bacterium]